MLATDRHAEILEGFAGRRIVVMGDLMLDEYLWGSATRISPEAPVMVVQIERESSVPGGAANVVNNLLALGASVCVVGVVGDDTRGASLRAMLSAAGAETRGIVTAADRPTIRKTRVIAHSQQVMRLDRELRDSLTEPVQHEVAARVGDAMSGADALLISDYDKGVLNPVTAEAAFASARLSRALVTANPKPPNVALLRGADLVSLNLSEARAAAASAGCAAPAIADAGTPLVSHLGFHTLVVTRGGEGLSIFRANTSPLHIPARPVDVYDVAGAGDTVISSITLGLVAGASVAEAADVANHAAACVVRKVGVATVTCPELLENWTIR